mmetsp:Transcript_13214/g.23534  ORF Transcript_13214/g.23534 Transcript_13214/m.23534 type:complete len:265 (-) Transcript_13214:637-1431(-)
MPLATTLSASFCSSRPARQPSPSKWCAPPSMGDITASSSHWSTRLLDTSPIISSERLLVSVLQSQNSASSAALGWPRRRRSLRIGQVGWSQGRRRRAPRVRASTQPLCLRCSRSLVLRHMWRSQFAWGGAAASTGSMLSTNATYSETVGLVASGFSRALCSNCSAICFRKSVSPSNWGSLLVNSHICLNVKRSYVLLESFAFVRFAETRVASPGGVGTGSLHSKGSIEPGCFDMRCVTSAGVFITATTAAPVRLYSLRLEVWLL